MANHSGVTFLGKPYDLDSPYREIIERIIEQKPWDEARCHALFREHVETLPQDKPVVLSDARLSIPGAVPAEDIPRRLKDIFGECRVFLTVRNQIDYVKSMYVQHIGTEKVSLPIDEWLVSNWDQGTRVREYLEYDAIHRRYAEVFGSENVLVNAIEELRSDREAYVLRLADFISIDGGELCRLFEGGATNSRMSRLQMLLQDYPRLYSFARNVSKHMPKSVFAVASHATGHDKPFDPELSERSMEMLMQLSTATNTNLRNSTGLSFDSIGTESNKL